MNRPKTGSLDQLFQLAVNGAGNDGQTFLHALPTVPLRKLAKLARGFSRTENELKEAIIRSESPIPSAAALAHQEYQAYGIALREQSAAAAEAFRRASEKVPLVEQSDWDPAAWQGYDPAQQRASEDPLPAALCAGSLSLGQRWSVPFLVPFIGVDGPLVIPSVNDRDREVSVQILRNLVWRIAILLPGQVNFYFIDPHNSGNAFHWANRLPGRVESTGELHRDLIQVESAFKRIAANYLNPSVSRFEQIDPRQRRREKLSVVVVADYPRGFESDPRSMEVLRRIGDNGATGGAYVLLHHDTSAPSPRPGGRNALEFKAAQDICSLIIRSSPANAQIRWSSAPDVALQAQFTQKLAALGAAKSDLGFREIVGLPRSGFWKDNSSACLTTPVGARGSDEDRLRILFGENEQGLPCVHGMVGASTGQGKSNLFHVILLGLAQRYSPEELRFYLVDGKDGVEFSSYRSLPHVAVLSLNTAPQLARSLLADLAEEMGRRNALFIKAGVDGYRRYREARAQRPTLPALPRILLVVDEYQELFDGDRDGLASAALADLTSKSRSTGIHLLLASQRFGATNMQRRDEIFSQIQLRIAMKLAQSEVATLTEFQREGKDAINALDGPGKVVINERSGQDGFNRQGIIALLNKVERDEQVAAIQHHAWERKTDLPPPIVFSGIAQPRLSENPRLLALAGAAAAPSVEGLQAFATRAVTAGGAGVAEWYASDHPRVGWVGQEFNVRGYATIVLRRHAANHVLLAGGQQNARHGMLVALLTGLALNHGAATTQFILLDRTPRQSPWEGVIPAWIRQVALPGRFTVRHAAERIEAEPALIELGAEVKRRRSLDDGLRLNQPTLIVVLLEPERLESLQRSSDPFAPPAGSPAAEALQAVLKEGSSLGVHLILSASGKRALDTVIDVRRSVKLLRLRLLLQMSEDESFDLTDSRRAASLQAHGDAPVAALLYDADQPHPIVFKPYLALAREENDSEPGACEELRAFQPTFERWANLATL